MRTGTDRHDPRGAVGGQGARRPKASSKWPRWLVANCISQPSRVRCSGIAITPAVLTSTCHGARHSRTTGAMDARSTRSSVAARTFRLPVVAVISATTGAAPSVFRTANVTSGAGPRQSPCRFGANARGAAGDNHAFTMEINPVADFGGGRPEPEWCNYPCQIAILARGS